MDDWKIELTIRKADLKFIQVIISAVTCLAEAVGAKVYGTFSNVDLEADNDDSD